MIDDRETVVWHNPSNVPPVSVTIYDTRNPGPLELYFEHLGDGSPFRGFKILAEGEVDLGKVPGFARRLPHYVSYARATIQWEHGDAARALEALRTESSTRGLPDTFYRAVAGEYVQLVEEGDPHPIKTIAERRPVDKSRASRWVTEARRRGYIEEKGTRT